MPKSPDPGVDLKEIMRLAGTDTGRQLMAMLRCRSGPALDEGIRSASAGDYGPLKRLLEEFFAQPDARELLGRLRGQFHG